MLVEAQRASRSKKAIVFLGWEPHPMNAQMKMNYLTGGDALFGAPGETKVYTAVPTGYLDKCPNVAAFLANLQFTTDMENKVMGPILEKVKPNTAARNFLRKNTDMLAAWLKDVKTFDGKDGLAAVTAALKK